MAMKKSVWDMILKVVIAVDHDCVKWKDSANSFCID